MGERFCPFCGRANRSDLPRCMNCGQRMMPAVPPQDGEVRQGRSVLLQHEDEETQTVVARTGNHEPWWRTPEGSPFGSIPPPPQVKEEMERFQAREEAKESVRRAEEAAKEASLAHERKKAAAALARAAARAEAEATKSAPPAPASQNQKNGSAANAAQLECLRCGTAPPPGGGFSFCLSCGGDLTGSIPASIFTAPSSMSNRAAAPASHSVAAPSGAGLHQRHETTTKTNTNVSVSLMQTTSVKTGSFPPGVAALLSFFVPGVGQIINGQIAKGVVLLLASFFVTAVLSIPTVGLLPLVGRVVSALDAYRIADRRRKGQTVRPDEWDLG